MQIDRMLVRQLRLQRSWSQETLAEVARLNPRTVQRLEAKGVASLRTCRSIAAALEVEPSMLGTAGSRSRTEDSIDESIGLDRHTRLRSTGASFLIGLYAVSAVLLFGFVVLDQVYARLLIGGQAATRDGSAAFSEVADFLLQFTVLATALALGALAAAWQSERTRWLLVGSILTGTVLPALLLVAINAFLPQAVAVLDASGAGPLIRLATFAVSAVLGAWAWVTYTRGVSPPALRQTEDRDPPASARTVLSGGHRRTP